MDWTNVSAFPTLLSPFEVLDDEVESICNAAWLLPQDQLEDKSVGCRHLSVVAIARWP